MSMKFTPPPPQLAQVLTKGHDLNTSKSKQYIKAFMFYVNKDILSIFLVEGFWEDIYRNHTFMIISRAPLNGFGLSISLPVKMLCVKFS